MEEQEKQQDKASPIEPVVMLLPCPFCGGKDLQTGHSWFSGNNDAYVHCRNCGGHISRRKGRLKKAIDAWNERPQEKLINVSCKPIDKEKERMASKYLERQGMISAAYNSALAIDGAFTDIKPLPYKPLNKT